MTKGCPGETFKTATGDEILRLLRRGGLGRLWQYDEGLGKGFCFLGGQEARKCRGSKVDAWTAFPGLS